MEAVNLSRGATVFSSRGLGKYLETDEKTGMAKVEIKTRSGVQVVNEFRNHLKLIKFNVGDMVVRKRLHRGQKLEGKVSLVIDHEQVNVHWEGSLQSVTVLTSELLSPSEYEASRRTKCLHV